MSGLPQNNVREYLLAELRLGLRFPGSGWVLRDLIWEQKYSPAAAASVPPLAGPRLSG